MGRMGYMGYMLYMGYVGFMALDIGFRDDSFRLSA